MVQLEERCGQYARRLEELRARRSAQKEELEALVQRQSGLGGGHPPDPGAD